MPWGKRDGIATKKYLRDANKKEQDIWVYVTTMNVHVKQCLSVAEIQKQTKQNKKQKQKQKTLTRALKP